ncbi:hypothetical protein ATKI12_0287 [Kitasatospora sp. Ki12]
MQGQSGQLRGPAAHGVAGGHLVAPGAVRADHDDAGGDGADVLDDRVGAAPVLPGEAGEVLGDALGAALGAGVRRGGGGGLCAAHVPHATHR